MGIYDDLNQAGLWKLLVLVQIIVIFIFIVIIKHLYKQAYTDPLTGLYSRRYFYKKMSELKPNTQVSLILLDIDCFKDINDTYGHLVGDKVLNQFADILTNNTRANDIICRWGGEEFAIILFRTNAMEVMDITKRIKSAIENYDFSCGNINCRITASIGIVSAKIEKGLEVEQLITAADKALYKAKEKKNCIIMGMEYM
ncbi:MAG: GGDEF domain-containing protein [Clostridia bacterium]|nr:GGDEF domain-containing protein [Clostridia bacterium]